MIWLTRFSNSSTLPISSSIISFLALLSYRHMAYSALCALLLLDCLPLKEPGHEGLGIKLCEIVESLACSHEVNGQL